MTKVAALILDNVAHIFEVAHIDAGDGYEDDAIQYMVERMALPQDAAVDGWVFADSVNELTAWAADRRIAIAA